MSQPSDPSEPASDECRQFGPSPALIRLCATADLILEAVEKAATPTTQHLGRDVNEALFGAAYGRAYRCLRSIRDLAYRGEGDDALILARSLVSLVGRSLYLVAPDDDAERRHRFERWLRSWTDKTIPAVDELIEAGFEVDTDRPGLARIAADLSGRNVPPLPNDHDVLASVGMRLYYVRIYRPASDVAHYGIGSALDGFVELPEPGDGGRIALKLPDAERAEEALSLAVITYGEFLQRSEPIIGHGVTATALTLVREYIDGAEDTTT